MRSGSFVRFLAAVVAVCCLSAAGCTSSGSSGVTLQTLPTTTTSSSVLPSSSVVVVVSSTPVPSSPSTSVVVSPSSPPAPSSGPVSPTSSSSPALSTSMKPAEREATDRKAIEALWSKYWTVAASLFPLSVTQQRTVMGAVAVNPALEQVLASTAKFNENGWVDYGTFVHHPYWTTPVGGQTTAVMGDCMDDSKAGTMEAKTGKKLTVGVLKDNTRITVVKGTDGSWKVQKIEYLVNQPC